MPTGHWLLLQNCHLNLAFCHELIESLMEGDVHQGFRLWITFEVHPQFPISLLQTAIKFTNEPPRISRIDEKDVDRCPTGSTRLFTITFLANARLHLCILAHSSHGTSQVRTTNQINQSDLNGAIQCVQNH